MFGVYAISNTKNGSLYIGGTRTSFEQRWAEHVGMLKRGKHYSRLLQHDWDTMGPDVFELKYLEVCNTKQQVREMEKYWYEELQDRAKYNSYNLSNPGDSSKFMRPRRTSQRQPIRIIQPGVSQSDIQDIKRELTKIGRQIKSLESSTIQQYPPSTTEYEQTSGIPQHTPTAFEIVAKLVIAGLVSETRALQIGFGVTPGASQRYQQARSLLKEAMERQAVDA
jgi:group I intron endonuclease